MKKAIYLLSMLLIFSCTKESQVTNLDIQITQNPIDGVNIQSASVSLIGTVKGVVKTIPVQVEWFKETDKNENRELMTTTVIYFSTGSPEAQSLSCLVKPHAGFSSYYFARFTWADSRGLNTIESKKALCR